MEDTQITVQRDEFQFKIIDGNICHSDSGWDFWGGDFPAVFEPVTMNWIKQYCDKDHDFLDIGAWVGPTTLWGSKFARSVVSFEPDPIAFSYLYRNVHLNMLTNVFLEEAAIAIQPRVDMFSRTYPGDSMSNMLGAGEPLSSVYGVFLDAALGMGDFNLMKMDIEGGEAIVLPPNKELLGDKKIPLMLSFHGAFYRNSEDFSNIIDAISVYDRFYNVDGVQISINQIQPEFDVILCL